MKRTISVMLGKGSVQHNSRLFTATNVDRERTALNRVYRDTPIRDVYSQLFDDAVKRYNAKQTRADRCITDYFEKIRTGKQEKLFHEVIFQVGNAGNMSAKSEDGVLASKVLDEFMAEFRIRNPFLYVFSAHLHMDEATPHLHIDFVPFTIGSKRGLDTRVSLKQALAGQGFSGGSRGETEWSQWVKKEKEQLAKVMERHGIEWEQLGTHDEHLSVMDFKKVQRAKEVEILEERIAQKHEEIHELLGREQHVKAELGDVMGDLKQVRCQMNTMKDVKNEVALLVNQLEVSPIFQLLEPRQLMSARSYHEKVAMPLVSKLKDTMKSMLIWLVKIIQAQQVELQEAKRQARVHISKLKDYEDKMNRESERKAVSCSSKLTR